MSYPSASVAGNITSHRGRDPLRESTRILQPRSARYCTRIVIGKRPEGGEPEDTHVEDLPYAPSTYFIRPAFSRHSSQP